ncbi:MAG TPA: hypothetical protein VFZ13_05935 [Gemmatimonadales bacterium]
MHRVILPLARRAGRTVVLSAIVFAAACSSDSTSPEESADFARGGQQGPDFRASAAAQSKHSERLMAIDGVEGHGLSLGANGEPVIRIFTRHGAVGGLPRTLDGVPVEYEVSGQFSAILPSAKPTNPGGGGSSNPTSRFNRPVPIGISIGNVTECSAGTLGARVSKGNTKYILSNNHVLARQNAAANGEDILQPGRYDTGCSFTLNDAIADLSQAIPISFSNDNQVDAAIAAIRSGSVDSATTSAGYGVPGRTPVNAAIGMSVQKCGRTTNCTTGTISTLNATVNVQYSGGIARFVGQIVISGRRGAFSKQGDSGSLIVTANAAASPVALLFAGSQTYTIGNPIQAVLTSLGVTIDGK